MESGIYSMDDGAEYYRDENGDEYWLDDDGEPNYDDPVITLESWLGDFGISSEDALNLQKTIIG
jgi:hypothetical protein